jgi:hypothetical protein
MATELLQARVRAKAIEQPPAVKEDTRPLGRIRALLYSLWQNRIPEIESNPKGASRKMDKLVAQGSSKLKEDGLLH